MYEEYKPNSHKFREEQKHALPEKKPEKVVTGEVVTRKKSGVQKFAESLVYGGIDNVRDYIIAEIVVPKARDMVYSIAESICDSVKDGISGLLYGRNSARGNTNYHYSSYYNDRNRSAQDATYRYVDRDYDFNNVVFKIRGDAERTLQELRSYISDYGLVSVMTLYECVGKSGVHTDNNYGWTDLARARVIPVRGGYIINLPKTVYLGDI